ncbi:MAG: T9SS C-terminal target domain-containing protein, partial [Bacteroidetes bacterium]
PSLGVLPVVWVEVRVEGAYLIWRVEGLEAGQRLVLERQEGGEAFSEWVRMASGLPWRGRYELPLSGLYRLVAEGAQGRLATSPVVEYRAQDLPRLYPNPAPGGPYVYQGGAVARLAVYNSQGQVVREVEGPVEREALRGLPAGVYWVELYTWEGMRWTQSLWVSP